MKSRGRWSARIAVVLGLSGVASSLAVDAAAQSSESERESKRIAVHVEGKGAAAIADQIAASGPDGLEVIEQAEFDKALRQVGLPTTLGIAIPTKSARKIILKKLQQAMKKVDAQALVLGRETLQGKKHELYVVLLGRDSDRAEIDQKVDLGNGDAAQRKAIKRTLEDALRPFAPPPPEPPKVDEVEAKEKSDEDEAKSEFRAHVAGHEFFAVKAGFQVGGRWFRYSDSVSEGNTRPYAVFGPPGLGAAAELYPGATSGIAVLQDLGLTVGYVQHFALKSKTAQSPSGPPPAEFDGSWNALDLALRYRLRLGDPKKPIVLGLSGGYGFERFVFSPANDEAAKIRFEVPTVRYQRVRFGLDGWLPFGMFAFAPRFSFLVPFGLTPPEDRIPGPGLNGAIAPEPVDDTVYTRFRGATAKGVAAGADVALVLDGGIEIHGGLDYLRYFSTFSPQLGDAFVAGGAVDESLELRLLGAYRY